MLNCNIFRFCGSLRNWYPRLSCICAAKPVYKNDKHHTFFCLLERMGLASNHPFLTDQHCCYVQVQKISKWNKHLFLCGLLHVLHSNAAWKPFKNWERRIIRCRYWNAEETVSSYHGNQSTTGLLDIMELISTGEVHSLENRSPYLVYIWPVLVYHEPTFYRAFHLKPHKLCLVCPNLW